MPRAFRSFPSPSTSARRRFRFSSRSTPRVTRRQTFESCAHATRACADAGAFFPNHPSSCNANDDRLELEAPAEAVAWRRWRHVQLGVGWRVPLVFALEAAACDLVADRIAEDAAEHCVREPVCLVREAADAYGGGQAVHEHRTRTKIEAFVPERRARHRVREVTRGERMQLPVATGAKLPVLRTIRHRIRTRASNRRVDRLPQHGLRAP